ncbi:MAG: hypothetical protein ACYDEX_10785 [Mobilitalea sp.]
MNGFKYRDIFSKIDTDKNMDQRIKNELLYHDTKTENVQKKLQNNSYDMSHRKSFFRSFSKVAAIRQAFPSIVFLTFIVVAFLGIRASLSNGALSPSTDIETDVATAIEITAIPAIEITEVPAIKTTEEHVLETTDVPVIEKTDIAVKETTENSSDENNETPDVETTERITKVTKETFTKVTTEVKVDEASITAKNAETPTVIDGDFYFAYFDVKTKGDVKASIPNLIVRLHGTVSSINSNDLTDIVLIKDGIQIENGISLTDKIKPFKWGYEYITDFYFKFADDNNEPGNYTLTGKYKGVSFKVYNKIIESQVSDIAANPDDLKSVAWAYHTDKAGNPMKISELVFSFSGTQNSFYQSDLTDLKITLNNSEIPFSFGERVFRYLETNGNGSADTSYNLVFNEAFTKSGSYVMTGKYQGKSFTSQEISIP